MNAPERVVRRILSKYVVDGECWISTYSTGNHGYAQAGWWESGKSHMVLCHRVAWCAANGRGVGVGMTVDHLCHVRKCINPDHLREISARENSADNLVFAGSAPPQLLPNRHCSRGHQLLRFWSGAVLCRECQNARRRANPTALMSESA